MLIEAQDSTLWCELAFAEPALRGATLQQLKSGEGTPEQQRIYNLQGAENLIVSLRVGGVAETPEWVIKATTTPTQNIVVTQQTTPFKMSTENIFPTQIYLKDLGAVTAPESVLELLFKALQSLIGEQG